MQCDGIHPTLKGAHDIAKAMDEAIKDGIY